MGKCLFGFEAVCLSSSGLPESTTIPEHPPYKCWEFIHKKQIFEVYHLQDIYFNKLLVRRQHAAGPSGARLLIPTFNRQGPTWSTQQAAGKPGIHGEMGWVGGDKEKE